MAWRVVEAFVQGKWDDPTRCEDVLVVTDHFAAVLDGATTRSGALIGGVSPDRFAALSGEKAIATLSPDATAAEAVAHLSQHLRLSLGEAGEDPEGEIKGGQRVIYSFVMVSRHRREVWRISDCAYAWDGLVDALRLEMERVPIEARSMLLHGLLASGTEVMQLLLQDPSEVVTAPLIAAQAHFRNRAGYLWSFAAIDGGAVPETLIDVVPIPAEVEEIILASDGWPELHGTLAASQAALARVLRDDPLMLRLHPAVKGVAPGAVSFDDRAYLRLRI